MTLAEHQKVEEQVVEQWKQHLEKLPADVKDNVNLDPPDAYWTKQYYPIAAFLFSGEAVVSPLVKESAKGKKRLPVPSSPQATIHEWPKKFMALTRFSREMFSATIYRQK